MVYADSNLIQYPNFVKINTRNLRLPKYRLHKPSGRAVIQFRPLYGRNPIYLPGAFNSEESRQAYASRCKEIASYRVSGYIEPLPKNAVIKIANLQRRYLVWAKTYYGEGPRTQYRDMLAALSPLRSFGKMEVKAFGPVALKKVLCKNGFTWMV